MSHPAGRTPRQSPKACVMWPGLISDGPRMGQASLCMCLLSSNEPPRRPPEACIMEQLIVNPQGFSIVLCQQKSARMTQ